METTTQLKKSKSLNIALWIVQGVLAFLFLMAGFMKSTTPIDKLATMLPWTKDAPLLLVRFIGISELLGGLGLLLPSILRIKPVLTPIAATGLTIIMILATFFHISKGEYNAIGMTILFGLIAVFIAWGRFKKVPIQSKKR